MAARLFRRLDQIGDFRRKHLSFIRTLEDLDIIREIGLHQVSGAPITLRSLLMCDVGSPATVQRRLRALKQLRVVEQKQASEDRRMVQLHLSRHVLRLYQRLDRIMLNTR